MKKLETENKKKRRTLPLCLEHIFASVVMWILIFARALAVIIIILPRSCANLIT